MIYRYWIDDVGELNPTDGVHKEGDVVRIYDLESRLKELRSEFLNDRTGERRFVVERIASELGINLSK